MRKLLGWIAAIAIVAGVIYLGSPYYTVMRLTQAARANDAKTVASMVDFPAVRAGLKPRLESYLQAEIARQQQRPHSFWEKLGLALAPYFAGPQTELLITPQNVAQMIRTGRPPHLAQAAASSHAPAALKDSEGPGDMRTWSQAYVGDDLDQFRAELRSRAHPADRVRLGLLRRGFFTWRVVSLDLAALPKTSAD